VVDEHVSPPTFGIRSMTGSSAPGEPLSVLVVDDEPQVVEHLSAGLELLGYATCRAASAAEAMARLAGDPRIAVVITDIRMPGGDGLSLAQDILQGNRAASPIQVVLITGHATLDDATTALRAGVSDMLRKPFRLAEAAAAVEKAMKAARAERAAAAARIAESARIAALEHDRNALAARLDEALGRLSTVAAADAGVSDHIRHEAIAISHALRTPLNAISGGAELMAHTGGGGFESNLQLLRGGVQQAVRAIELVEELYRAEKPQPAQPRTEVSLSEVVRTLRVGLAEPLAEKKLELRLDLPEPPVTLHAPLATVQAVLVHALEAAIDWSMPGSTIALGISTLAEDGMTWAVVTVASAQPGATPPIGRGPDSGGSVLSRTQEDLHFAIARRLVTAIGGRVHSWNDGHQAMAIRVALPLMA
jgi:CheY-like chemotaxis protein